MQIDPHEWVTFLPDDRPRRSRIAIWDPKAVDGLFDQSLEPIEIALVDGRVHRVGARVAEIAQVLDWLAQLPRATDVHQSFHALAMSVRLGLDLVARGRLLPWITADGWDTWRLGPIEPVDANYMDRIADAMPAALHCGAFIDLGDDARIAKPEVVLGQILDSVADSMVRTPAAAVVAGNPAFADHEGMPIPHLRPWLTELVQPYAAGCRLLVSAIPPSDDEGTNAPWLLDLSLRSSKDPSIVISAEDLWRSPTAAAAVLGELAESEFLIGLRQAVLICPALGGAMEEVAPNSVVIHNDDVLSFLDAIPDLRNAGIEVRWPGQSGSATIEQRPRANSPAPPGDLRSVMDLQSLLDVQWEVVLNGITLTQTELEQLSAAKRPVVKIRGQWVVLDEQQRKRLSAPPPTPAVVELLAAGALAEVGGSSGGTFSFEGGGIGSYLLKGAIADASNGFNNLRFPEPLEEPDGFKATLRDYQRVGLGWMRAIVSLGTGGILADDMGLGKTIQILALHAGVSGPNLVVCPTSVLTNWEREAERFVPDTTVIRYHGPNRSLPDDLDRNTIVLTTYGVIRSDAEALGERSWNLVVADEAQAMKNPNSRTAKAMRVLGGNVRFALTGTPVENKLLELWSIGAWVLPGLLGSMSEFRTKFAMPIERDGSENARDGLQALVSTFLLRRRKTDPGIAPELPDKLERDLIVPMTTEQITLYKAVADQCLEDLRSTSDEISRQGMVLKMLTALKQITNHPASYLGETAPLAGRSGKLDALTDLLAIAADTGEGTLVFTQYVRMGNLIVDYCGSQGYEVGFLHGSCSVKQRQILVDRFQSGELPILILSLKAGGTGLNLTAASHVVHYDRWWNPAVEDQATDRAYRIGQNKTVNVHRLVTAGTVEDRIAEMLTLKRDLADSVLAGGEAWIGNLSNEELAALIRLDTRPSTPMGSDSEPMGSDPEPMGSDPEPMGSDPEPMGSDPFRSGSS